MKKTLTIRTFLPALLGTVILLTSGCGDSFFNETAGDRITPDLHYQSMIDADVSLQGAIVPLQDALPNLIILDGLRSDAMDITANADANLRAINDQIFQSGNPYTNPANLYKVIVNINETLAHIDEIALKDPNFNVLRVWAYKGALIGMRSWTYLTLARLYGKAVYIEGNLTSLPANLQQEVMTKPVLLDTLISQMLPYIQDNTTGTQYEELRFDHFVNNKALLGELYLEKNDYANAVTYLKLACESYLNQSAMLKVDKTYRDAAWRTIFLNAESANVENFSVVPYSTDEGQFNPLVYWIDRTYQYMVKPSSVLIDSFMVQVPAAGNPGDLWRGLGVTFGVDTLLKINDSTYVTEPYIIKYQVDNLDPLSSDIVISRAADVHLLLAEALNRTGNFTSQKYALMLLNDGVNKTNPKPAPYTKWAANLGVRGRVYLKANELPDRMTGEPAMLYIENLIVAERALELAFEGKRWSDLVRVAERRGDPAYLADRVAAKFAGTPKYDEIRNKLLVPANWYLPFE